ncbi:PAC2 family protein [Klenkia sp. PcliD-1-E]|uniref:PAC2 family protein n=1 Tax=Klenkia sp. PcliD-1-E TaxID=2954492 RepID=UPI0027DF74D0|nr:PAC2 family protein [Klenkia sp. PcliD-1-E]
MIDPMSGPSDLPRLTDPVVVVAFEGWNDAGDAATGALEHLELTWDAQPLAALDPEDYYDFQVNRPQVNLVDGISRRIEWPTTRISVARRPAGSDRDVVLVRGIEPNMRWRGFCAELIGILTELDVSTVVALGALLADTPHTRPTPVTGSAYDEESARTWGLETSKYSGPTGILGVFQDACVQAGLPAVSFWAAVPHYVSQPPSPQATVALLHRVEEVLELTVPMEGLTEQAAQWVRTVDEMAADDDEVVEYVRALEEKATETDLADADGDQIAREFERYLKRRDRG